MTKEQERSQYFKQLFNNSQLELMGGSELLSLASKFTKIEQLYLDENRANLVSRKIAVLGSFTTHHLISILRLFLYQQGISPEFYEGPYDSITMELMDPDSGLYDFKPDILLILTYHNDIKDYPGLFAAEVQINDWVQAKTEYYRSLWNRALSIPGCQIFQTTFVEPAHRALGNMEANYLFSPSNCIRALNMSLIGSRPSHVNFIDMEYFASYFGKNRWFDAVNYYLSKQGFSLDASGHVCYAISRILSPLAGITRKCLVLDLDNTLWGGVIGDDGLEGININPSDPVGEAFLAFQKYLLSLKERGVLLAVCSKNDENTARLPFQKHPDMLLSLDDIACFIANWDDKASNIRQIANQLNIGIDSLVFFDDNPFEREIVRQFVPEVEVIEVPEDPALYIGVLDRAMCFESAGITEEDLSRSDSYIVDRNRSELASQIDDYDSYLQTLEMKAQVSEVTPMELSRFTQLINKSNQFNLRTQRYTEATINKLMDDKDNYSLQCIALEDKFGKYGIISCLIVEKCNDKAFIDTWVMSCRVLKRGVENVAYNAIRNIAVRWQVDWIVGEYLPTLKNGMVSNLYSELGFEPAPEGWVPDNGGTVYRLNVAETTPKDHYIKDR